MSPSENLLFDIEGRNGEAARISAIADIMDAFDQILIPKPSFQNIEYLSTAPKEQLLVNLGPVELTSKPENHGRRNIGLAPESAVLAKAGPRASELVAANPSPFQQIITFKSNPGERLVDVLKLDSKEFGGGTRLCVRCHRTNPPKRKRCVECRSRLSPPYIETKLRKFDDFVRRILFPA